MQKQKCSLKLYTNFLIANHNRYSGLELSKVSFVEDMCHDAVSRWLASSNFTPSDLWNQVKSLIDDKTGYLLCDDTLLNKQYSRVNELAKKQCSGNVSYNSIHMNSIAFQYRGSDKETARRLYIEMIKPVLMA
ncbi:MAG: hypothetical protein ACXVHU_08730 [Methanobacterium sp.]